MASSTDDTIFVEIKILRFCPRVHYVTDPDVNGEGWTYADSGSIEGSGVARFGVILRSTTTRLFFYFDTPDGLFVHSKYYGKRKPIASLQSFKSLQ